MNCQNKLTNNYQIAIEKYLKKEEANNKSIKENGFPMFPPPLVPQISYIYWKEAKENCNKKNSDYHVWSYINRSFYLYCDNDGKYWCYTQMGKHEHIEPYQI